MHELDRARYDLAVIGASFAGLACAEAAAARGLRTVVLEKKTDAGAGIHTTGIVVKEVFDEWSIPAKLTRKIHGVRLYARSLRWIDLSSPGYYFLATDTPALLRWFARAAESAGAELRFGAAYDAAAREDRFFAIRGAGGETRARVLVGADGPRSRVARDFGLGVNREFLIGMETELQGVRGLDEDRLHCFLDSELAPGYIAWIVPGLGITQVGLACRPPARPRLDLFLERLRTLFDLSGARAVGRRGGLIPVGGRVHPFARGRAVLVGDAAGLVSPLTAGGIHTALSSGRRAGQAISELLLDGGREPESALGDAYPAFAMKSVLRKLIDLRPDDRLLDLFFAQPVFRRVAQMIFFHHRGLFSRQAWRELAEQFRHAG